MIKIKEAACAGSIISRQRVLINALVSLFEAARVYEKNVCIETWTNFIRQLRKCEKVINEQSD
jgi:hypothetical protein